MATENLKSFLEKIKGITLFKRIFKWGETLKDLIIVVSEFDRINAVLDSQGAKINELENERRIAENNFTNLQNYFNSQFEELVELRSSKQFHATELSEKRSIITRLETTLQVTQASKEAAVGELAVISNNYEILRTNFDQVVRERDRLLNEEVLRNKQHQNALDTLVSLNERVQNERDQEIEIAHQNEINKLNKLKETWAIHQSTVVNKLKLLAEKLTILYVDDFPHTGTPDSVLSIGDMVVFDAKSPASGENLNNFPNYLKTQAEAAKKYAKLDGVKKEIFFVVPSNTLEVINQFVYNMGDYQVNIISIDSLEVVITGLKKIETLQYVEQLEPEDRESICRIIGRFQHLAKRRIQVDNFFAKHFLEMIFKVESELPDDVIKAADKYERGEKLNPPQEKRTKSIATSELDKSSKKISRETEIRGISSENEALSISMDEIKLHAAS